LPAANHESLFMAQSLPDAVAALADRGSEGAALAGATWIMRAPIRRERPRPFHVGIRGIRELRGVEQTRDAVRIGACVTHAELAAALADEDQFDGLVAAASGAANPAIRQIATVGGNLSTWDFAASDLPPALLCLDATVELEGVRGSEHMPIDRFLAFRRGLEPGTLVTGVKVERKALRSGHARLPLRRAGDYPTAIVSMAASLGADGRAETIRIAVGSVEPSPRRWTELEEQLAGRKLEPATAQDLARGCADVFKGRDGIEAPGWYRVEVLPALVRRAAEALLARQPARPALRSQTQ
jgi:carbon-monoxide dehydrogenase medium subunit